ncbi:hypothetical protein BsWGS_07165 [Bradybaena similaris]
MTNKNSCYDYVSSVLNITPVLVTAPWSGEKQHPQQHVRGDNREVLCWARNGRFCAGPASEPCKGRFCAGPASEPCKGRFCAGPASEPCKGRFCAGPASEPCKGRFCAGPASERCKLRFCAPPGTEPYKRRFCAGPAIEPCKERFCAGPCKTKSAKETDRWNQIDYQGLVHGDLGRNALCGRGG